MTPEEKEELHNLKLEVEKYSGFNFEGNTQQELKDSLRTIHWSLEHELSKQINTFYKLIEKLNIPKE